MIPGTRHSLAALALLAAVGSTPAVTIEIANFLDAGDFGVPEATIDGVFERAASLWEGWLPTGVGGKPADHPQNAKFMIAVIGKNIDASGANPANTMIPMMARPSGEILIGIEINTDDDAIAAMYWDPTPATTLPSEFSVALGLGAGKWRAVAGDAGFGKFDMLTVMLHEIGHAVGFSRDYGDFSDWADNVWNPAHPENEIGTPAHFKNQLNLMSNAAGFAPDAKSGRSFLQSGDAFALENAFGYMVPAPSTPVLVLLALGLAVAARRLKFAARRDTAAGAAPA